MISQSQSHPVSAPSSQGTATRILLIDDDPEQTKSVSTDLEATGNFEAHSCNSSIMGLEMARSLRPDIIILDICMPFLDGGDILTSMELDPELRDIPVIVCTSLVSKEETGPDGTIDNGGQTMMAKPLRIDQLSACIGRKLNRNL